MLFDCNKIFFKKLTFVQNGCKPQGIRDFGELKKKKINTKKKSKSLKYATAKDFRSRH